MRYWRDPKDLDAVLERPFLRSSFDVGTELFSGMYVASSLGMLAGKPFVPSGSAVRSVVRIYEMDEIPGTDGR